MLKLEESITNQNSGGTQEQTLRCLEEEFGLSENPTLCVGGCYSETDASYILMLNANYSSDLIILPEK